MAIVGTPVTRVEDGRLIAGRGSYVDNLRDPALAGAACAVFVRSPLAHGRIEGLDLDAARTAPGVLGVFTAGDVDLSAVEAPGFSPPAMARPNLAGEVVRYVGEPVAVVVAEDRYQAADAAGLVDVEYRPLPPVVSVEASLTGEALVFPDAGTNVAYEAGALADDDPFAGCEVVISRQLTNQRLAPVPMETRVAACAPAGDGGLVLWLSTQAPHAVRDQLTNRLGLVPGQLRVVAPDVGGGFGAKIAADVETGLLCWLVRRLGRAVRWAETRSESMVSMTHGRAQHQTITIGGQRDGTLLAYRLDALVNAGAYPHAGAWMATPTVWMAGGAYAIPRIEARARSVLTNTTPTGAYRGAGRPEAIAAIERAVDLFASEIGMDPAEVRRRNLVPPQSFPYRTSTGVEYDSGDYPAALEALLAAADYPALRAEQARRRAANDPVQYGIGLSSYVEITGLGGDEYGRLVVAADGSVTAHVGTQPNGQGHETTFAMIIADQLGVPMDRITVRHGDTEAHPNGGGTFGSRSLQLGGSALHEAADQLCGDALPLAAAALQVDDRDVALDRTTGQWRVRDEPARGISWAELARRSQPSGQFVVDVKYAMPERTFTYGAHLALVEVDTETGKATLIRFIAVDDAGRIINPLLVEGQRHGGIAQGIGQALYEEMVYDSDGNPITASLADYTAPTAADLPNFELLSRQVPTPHNPLGAKGIGEAGTIGATPAVQNAVIDAVSHLGVRHIDMPLTPQRIWEAIAGATR